jgi:hypothetical protein
MKLSPLCKIAAIALLGMPAAWAQNDLQEGLWEVSVTMEMGGQPASAKPFVMRQCIAQTTAQDVMAKLVGAGNCSTGNLKQDGNRATWTVTCTTPVELDAEGSATFGRDTFDGSMSGQIGMSNQKLPFSQNFTARRVGACQ